MRIQHNQGLFTQNRYTQTNTDLNKTLNKLSSGYKINQAADDAAGLTISEKMRGQIRGLEQASVNIQDGLSLLNTADGGLGQIQNPYLVRIRELIIQAANDTNTDEDRQNIQLEIDQLKRGIDDIAEGTEFNTIQVLSPKDLRPDQNVKKFDIVFLIDDSGTMAEDIDKVTLGLSTFAEKMNTFGDVQIASTSIVHGPDRDLYSTANIDQVKNHLRTKHVAMGGTTRTDQDLMDIVSGSKNLGLRSDSEKVYVILTDTNSESNDLNNITMANALNGSQVYIFGMRNSEAFFAQEYGAFATDIFVPTSAEDISENLTPNLAETIAKNSSAAHKLQKDLILQVGANAGQQVIVPLYDNRSAAIGVNDVNIADTYDTAMEALKRIDIANKIISERRSQYGALYNRLEHAHSNVKNTSENLTKAESNLRDADMAKEISKLTKDQVLMQSSQAMMTQINQMSQGVLQILK